MAKRRTTGNQARVASSSGQNIEDASTTAASAVPQDADDVVVELDEHESKPEGEAPKTSNPGYVAEGENTGVASSDEIEPAVDPHASRLRKPRPSLSERTIQTIAQIPPTPSPSRRKSGFYQPQSPMQLSENGSPVSKVAPRVPPVGGLRGPSFSNGLRAPAFALPRAVSSPQRTGAPQSKISAARTVPRMEASGTAAGGALKPNQDENAAGQLHNKKPTASGVAIGCPGQQKPRRGPQNVSSASNEAATEPDGDRRLDTTQSSATKGPSSSSGRTQQSSTVSKSVKKPSDDLETSPTGPTKAPKSSAALRESIAKAKAAQKKSAVKKPTSNLQPATTTAMDTLEADFAANLDLVDSSPENLVTGQQSLRQRVEAARTSGRLNISAMGLRAIPDEVLNMYHLEQLDSSKGAWYESVDLVRFSAADNELESIDERVIPNVDPNMELDGTDEREFIFGGLEMLDLHRNQLQALPPGLRFLERLTSLHLVRPIILMAKELDSPSSA